jgi:hypothetical protein
MVIVSIKHLEPTLLGATPILVMLHLFTTDNAVRHYNTTVRIKRNAIVVTNIPEKNPRVKALLTSGFGTYSTHGDEPACAATKSSSLILASVRIIY